MGLSARKVGPILLLMLTAAVAVDDVTRASVQSGSRKGRFRWERDEWFEAQFTGHPKFACAKTGYPRGDKFPGYDRKFLFKTPESPKNLFCSLRGSDNDLRTMIRHVGLKWSARSLRRGGMMVEVSAPEVRCVARPRLLPSLFDLVLVAGRAPHHAAWCLLVQSPPPPHDAYHPRFPQPTGGALAVRIHLEHIPDVLCSPDVRRNDETEDTSDEDVDFFVQGFLENWSTYFRCNFQRSNNTTGPSARTLLLSVVLQLGLSSGLYRGRPVTWLPAHTCREACPDRAPRPDDLLRLTGSYKDDYGLDVTVTSPSGRAATCDVPERPFLGARGPSIQLEATFPGRSPLVCHSHRVPIGQDVDGTEFYFIVRLDVEFEDAKVFRCKMKYGEQLGGDKEVEASLMDLAQQVGLRVFHEDVELGRTVPSVLLGPSSCESEPPPDYLHHFQVTGDFTPVTKHCAFGQVDRPDERQDPNNPAGGLHSDTRIY
ncbi:uncharacterized protein LOC126284607 isoform X1 [Schistocerca gregaria]|uniref:uncharacterized protein LOC126284607 isoform X1 n=1 Tax=Schistocerca gregaria TaxID=7010 RepID=UPI00211DF4EC|nr:uncharacterized protein LOC126284607 isoform X1 [Schistocerca gregaria]